MVNKLVMVDIPDSVLSWETRSHLERYRPGGVILFKKNIQTLEQTRALVLELKAILGEDLLLAVDMEGGGVWRSDFLPCAPSAMSLGAANDPKLAYQIGALVGRGLRAIGANWNFAPVLDVNNNPANPVISDRSFGQDPKQVQALGLAWAEGLISAGVAACGKHFPGHGDTHLDSHLALPTVTRNLDSLEENELVPFRAAVAQNLPSIMTAHIVYPALDPKYPATLSKIILTDLLRERGGYTGVIVTDSMGMDAIDKNYGRGEAAVLSLQAGADMLEALGSTDAQAATFSALEHAEARGKLPDLEPRLERLRALARRFPIAPLEYSSEQIKADSSTLQAAWQRGIVAYKNPVLPALGTAVTLLVADEVQRENVSELGMSGASLAAALGEVYRITPILYDHKNPLASLEQVRCSRQPVIFASTVRRRLAPEVKTLVAAAKPILHLALWNAYNVQDVDAPALITFGYRKEAIAALLEILRGAPITGVLPIDLD
ncbi:MAG: beta-N-acetylhexosaminidase [Deinococcales bacterium]